MAERKPSLLESTPMPRRIAELPVAANGYPVPWFVAWIDGQPDFRVVRASKPKEALTKRLCWICGQRMNGAVAAFVLGPMCAINRTSSEPPSHRECAIYSAKVCPFLVNPKKRRREGNLPEDRYAPDGIGLKRNPGVALVWVTRSWKLRPEAPGLLAVGPPAATLWFAEGRDATRDEVLESIMSGLPHLTEMAEAEGPESMRMLDRMLEAALALVPAWRA